MSALSTTYYRNAIDLSDPAIVEAELTALLNTPIHSVEDLETWVKSETKLSEKITEVLVGHMVDFYRDTTNAEKRDIHMNDQTQIQPLLLKYQSELNRKFCESPYVHELDDKKYGLMHRVRATSLELYREENVPLQVREQELITDYNAIIGGLQLDWDGEKKPLPFLQAQLDSPNRDIRERAWKTIQAGLGSIKDSVNALMDELIRLRHQIAVNAGFENYRDYAFREKNREYTLEQCRQFHAAVEKFVVPVWDAAAEDLRKYLSIDTYRPWDVSSCTMSKPPFQDVDELINGVREIFQKTDEEFTELFMQMNENGLLDLEGRSGKAPGGFCVGLPVSRTSFVFANFSPSYFALIALIHEMGHAINGIYQLRKESEFDYLRAEIAELYSHSMELICLDKLDVFYDKPEEFRAAVRERLRRSLQMLMGPLSGDAFQHWMYENPNHTAAERDEAYRTILKKYAAHPVDWSGFEEELGALWINSIHFIAYPFYNIEYSMAELGALRVMQAYQENPAQAIANYKRGASADYSQSIAAVYAETGVAFDFSDAAIEQTAQFVKELWQSFS